MFWEYSEKVLKVKIVFVFGRHLLCVFREFLLRNMFVYGKIIMLNDKKNDENISRLFPPDSVSYFHFIKSASRCSLSLKTWLYFIVASSV